MPGGASIKTTGMSFSLIRCGQSLRSVNQPGPGIVDLEVHSFVDTRAKNALPPFRKAERFIEYGLSRPKSSTDWKCLAIEAVE